MVLMWGSSQRTYPKIFICRGVGKMKIFNLILIFLVSGTTLCMTSMAQTQDNQTQDNLVQLVPKCDAIKSAENISMSSNVGPGNAQLTYILSWVNSSSVLDMMLITPSGKKIDSSAQSPILYEMNGTTITYIVPDPETGKWNAEITAKTAPELGEDFCVFPFLTLGGTQINDTSEIAGNQILTECATCNQSG